MLNKRQAVDDYLGKIDLKFSHRVVHQTILEGIFVNDATCEWFVDYSHSLWKTDELFHRIDDLARKNIKKEYDIHASYSIMGGYWHFESNTETTVDEIVELVRNGYKLALESLHWCEKHQSFSPEVGLYGEGYCYTCEDEDTFQ